MNLDTIIGYGKKILLAGIIVLGILILLTVIFNFNLGVITRLTRLLAKVSVGQWMGLAIIIILIKR